MKVWLITVGEPLPLGVHGSRLWRTGIVAELLAQYDHEVVWWTSTVNHFTKQHIRLASERVAVAKSLTVQFLHGRLYYRNVSIARYRNHLEIAREFRRLASREDKPDIILSSYPTIELSAEAVRYAEKHGVPVLLDIRDLWPDELARRLPRVLASLSPQILWPFHRAARYALSHADGLIAISSEYLGWGLRMARRSECARDAVFTHGYPDPGKNRGPSDRQRRWLQQFGLLGRNKIIWFVGTFVGSIDLGTVIEAAKLLAQDDDITFVFTGSGERNDAWRQQAADLDNVVFTGWVDEDHLKCLASVAWIGLAAYERGATMSLTNKLFEYLSYGLPVLVSLPGEARQIIEENHCGRFYEPGEPSQLALVIRDLASRPDLVESMSRNARQVFCERYSASAVYSRLIEHLEAIVHKAPNMSRDPIKGNVVA